MTFERGCWESAIAAFAAVDENMTKSSQSLANYLHLPSAIAAAFVTQIDRNLFDDPHVCCRRLQLEARLVCSNVSFRIRMDTNTSCT